MSKKISRRKSLEWMGKGGMALALSGVLPKDSFAATTWMTKRKVHLFSKHLQWLNYTEMAQTAAEIGFDGVDLTVRPKGHVLPENVERDLPKAVEAIRKAGMTADRITTAVTDPKDPLTERILKTASQLDIKYYRLGWLDYDQDKPMRAQLEAHRKQLEELAAMNKGYGIHGAYQNHAGTSVGAPVWDIWVLIKDIDPEWLGARYDIRHAVVEGMKSWELGLQLLAPHIRSLDLKDFQWLKKGGEWDIENVPLGKGAVDFSRYFELLKKWNIDADITLHLEYPLGGADKGAFQLSSSPKKVIKAMRKDLAFVRGM